MGFSFLDYIYKKIKMTLSELTEENRELTEGDDYLNVLAIKDLFKNKKN